MNLLSRRSKPQDYPERQWLFTNNGEGGGPFTTHEIHSDVAKPLRKQSTSLFMAFWLQNVAEQCTSRSLKDTHTTLEIVEWQNSLVILRNIHFTCNFVFNGKTGSFYHESAVKKNQPPSSQLEAHRTCHNWTT